MHEIERKFLVTIPLDQIIDPDTLRSTIEQCYLPSTGDWTVRVRRQIGLSGVECTQTMKRRLTERTCIELETPITENYFEKVSTLCGHVLKKTRHEVRHKRKLWEIDLFANPEFEGLILAEIELEAEDEKFSRPKWLGREVTHDKNYKNVKMAKKLRK